jgi:hypothetical protein
VHEKTNPQPERRHRRGANRRFGTRHLDRIQVSKLVTTCARSAAGIVVLTLVCASCASPVPHADHTPRHGGVVMMNGDLHYEVVLNPKGEHRVYFSDALRAELPASVTPEVIITVKHQEDVSESLKADIDSSGKFWVAHGTPVENLSATARISFTVDGKPYWIELPFGLGSL